MKTIIMHYATTQESAHFKGGSTVYSQPVQLPNYFTLITEMVERLFRRAPACPATNPVHLQG